MNKLLFYAFIFSPFTSFGQVDSLLNKALESGNKRKFFEARDFLQQEIKLHPGNAEAYYWLARYAHYIVYDSRPFPGKGDQWSKQEVLTNLRKAISLKPGFGDACYFLAVEYGARAREALRKKNVSQARKELTEAKQAGAFPDYILQYAALILNACDHDAILFVAGDGIYNAALYLQLVTGTRKDISLIALGLLEQPYYVKMVRDGIKSIIPSVPLRWNDDLIMESHTYVWMEQEIKIPLIPAVRTKYGLPGNQDTVSLSVPDWGGSLMNMSAVILNILENNQWKRPVYCALRKEERDLFIFSGYLQNQGFVSEMMPYEAAGTTHVYDEKKFSARVLNPENYSSFSDIQMHDQPRADYFFAQDRRAQLLDFTAYLISNKQYQQARGILEKMDTLMPESILPLSEALKQQYEKLAEITAETGNQ